MLALFPLERYESPLSEGSVRRNDRVSGLIFYSEGEGMLQMALKRHFYCCLMGLSLLLPEPVPAADMDREPAGSVLKKIDGGLKDRDMYMGLKQIIMDPAGRKKTIQLELYRAGKGERLVYHYLSPVWVKGIVISIENKGRDIRVTSPYKKEIRDIPRENLGSAVMESDFTYEDLAFNSWADHYSGTNLRVEDEGGAPCHVLSLRPGYPGSAYTRLVMWVDVKEYTVNRIDYYQKNESTPFKRLTCRDFRAVGGARVCTEIEVQHLYSGRSTIQMVTELRFDEDVDFSGISGSAAGQ